MKTIIHITFLLFSAVLIGQTKTIFRTVCNGTQKELDSLLIKQSVHVQSKNKSNLLHFATYCNKEGIFNFLLKKNVDINAINNYGDTPLMYAVLRRNIAMTKSLIAKGAKVNTVNKDSLTPLYNAVQSDNKELIDLLIKAKADVNLGTTLLHKAVLNNSLYALKKIISKKTDIDPVNDYGNTPLALAIRENNPEIAEYLITKGADLKKVPKYTFKGNYLGQKRPDSIPLIFAKSFVSTENFVHSPTFSSDGTELYYTVESWRYHGGTIFVTKQQNGVWTTPKPVEIDGDYREIDPFLSPDNNTLYYCTDRPLTKSDSTRNNCDMWMLKRKASTWGKPIHLGTSINNSEHHDWFPTLSNDGTLFYSTGPNRTSNIVLSQSKNGTYQKPIDLGPNVNSESRDYDPAIAPDKSFLIFSSNRPGGFGSVDLYISFKDKNGHWTKAQNMGPLINTKTIEFAPRLSPDGAYLFFNREGSIFWVSIKDIQKLKH
ncbi:ankyrin repeat domain-containing protein [Flavobacteriaceae bacterium S356]|uniref:Ankyrin repeat domain-containing protein n=1 Tax=Asprobacillus argus TaxID=3076534 RepID=A0ABU3LDX4_9FLAO|nr:ankyrin repeat domain-containing protein [Flavobacteriaceae bacterium S356]